MVLTLLAGRQALALEQRAWTASYPFPAAGRLAVENVQGNIQVEGCECDRVELTVVKTATGPYSRLDDVRIAVGFGDGSLAVRTVYPPDSGQPVRVDYRIRAPRRTRLEGLRTVQGDIRVFGVEGWIDARTLFGNIEQVNVAGRVEAHSVNGKIAVSLRALPARGTPLRLDTVNGDLELVLPARADADLELSTVSGKIEGDYYLTVSDAPGDHTRRARLGRGGTQVRLRTVRGNIRVSKSQSPL